MKVSAGNSTLKKMFLLVFLWIIPLSGINTWGIIIKLRGAWNVVVDQSSCVGVPGMDFNLAQESPPDVVSLSVRKTHFQNWEIDIRKEDIHWHPRIRLFIRRSSNGHGSFHSGVLWGTRYIRIRNHDVLFFIGWGSRDLIGLQFKLNGITTRVPADTYTTTIYYTAVELF